MKKVCALFLTSLLFHFVNAQQGSPLLTHFTESRNIENQSWAICQDENHVMFFANRKGILMFDGEEWATIRIPAIPYSMQRNPFDGKIYVGGNNKLGYIEREGSGSFRFVPLSGDSISAGIITKIVFDRSNAWFYSDQSIIRFNTSAHEIDLIIGSKPGYPFTGMFVTPANTFINVLNKGLHRIDSDTLFPIVTGYITGKTEVLFALPYNSTRVLVGFGNSTLHLFDGIKYYDYAVNDKGYLMANILSEGIALGDTAYAFSTLEGGAIIVEKSSSKLLFTLNNKNQLPDDEVFALGSDNTGGLWLSHQYGLTRADLNLPVSNFTIFPGLAGNLSSALKHNNELYVATSEGIFCLSEVRSYDEKEIVVKTKQSLPAPEAVPEEHLEEGQNARKKIFSRIFGKKTDPQPVVIVSKPAPLEEINYTRRKISTLRSVDHLYQKVEGLNEKCRQLVSTPYGILAATNRGLYIINDHKAKPVTSARYINHISLNDIEGRYFIGAMDGYFTVRPERGEWITEVPDPEYNNPVYSVSREKDGTLWFGGDNIVFRKPYGITNEISGYRNYSLKTDFPERYIIDIQNDSIFLYSESGIYLYNSREDRFVLFSMKGSDPSAGNDLYYPFSNRRLILFNNKWFESGAFKSLNNTELALLKIFDEVISVTVEEDYLWVIEGNNRLYAIDRKKHADIDPLTDIFIKSISNGKGIKFDIENVKFNRGNNIIRFNIVAPGYLKQNTTHYQYFIDEVMTDWSPWSVATNYVETVTKPGDHILQMRARDIWGNIGDPESVKFTITAPFTKTWLFYAITGLFLLSLVILVVWLKERQLKNKNRLLEDKVRERTAEIEARKREITSSIEYAGRIQNAILPAEDHFRESFSDFFILYKPRDIVSGDFYWIAENDKSVFFTVADCTGHGVPGAFMSSMGISMLQEIIANSRALQANKVLNLLRRKIVNALHQTGKLGEMSDGMDIAFCMLSRDRKTLQFSGAFNPLIIIQNGKFMEYKGDKMPIGIHHGKESTFTNNIIEVNRGDTIFLFSDGYASQFGGPDGSKYKKSNFKDLLFEIYKKPMDEQRIILETELEDWKGSINQVDDITVVGLRI
ncbi:MAG TPA: hypothetical protein DDW27_06675 [Bacteroidales bacterium]|nr:hypothetical protein [Bacteroidales bacterium]